MLRLGALVAAATVACSASAAQAAYPGGNGRIVFVESARGIGGAGWRPTIVSVQADGSDRQTLTRPTRTSADLDPAWSPDGRLIAYVHVEGSRFDSRSSTAEIWVMRADGSRKRRVTRNAVYDGEPVWSPDGRRILFVRGRLGADLWTMGADGGAERRLTRTPEAEREPSWSPRGGLIAFVVVRGGERELWTSAQDGSDRRQTGLGGDLHPSAPTWSPDGTQLAVGTTRGILTLTPGGLSVRVLGGGASPAYAPDGSSLVVSEQFGLRTFFGLALLGLDGRARPLTRDPAPAAELLIDHVDPDWQAVR